MILLHLLGSWRLLHNRNSAAWDWGGGAPLGRCDARLLMDARNSPRSPLSVTVYGNLTSQGKIDLGSKLGSLQYPTDESEGS